MTTTNPDDAQNIITKLDNLLAEGHLKYRTIRTNYPNLKDKKEFKFEKFIKDARKQLDGWFQATIKILDKSFSEKYHLFHFIQHKGSAMSLVEIPGELSSLLITFEFHLYALEDIILRLEERRNLAIRQEIAEKEHQTDILYKVTFSHHTREVKLNNMLLAKLNSDSKPLNFFEYVYSRPNIPINIKDIEDDTALDLKKSVQGILRDLGFKATVRTVFFPMVTKSKIMFTNPITKQYWIKHDLPIIKIPKSNEIERDLV